MSEDVSHIPANAVLLLDRFISASSAQDAVESLEAMLDGYKSSEEPWEEDWILKNEDVLDHLTHLLQHGTLKNGDFPCGDDGIKLVCQLYEIALAKHSASLQKPAPGQLLEALLDVMDNAERQIYTRVLALQVLEQLSRKHSSIASSQWLQAPNGLHRLADMLSLGIDNPVEEVVRNKALAVAHIIAREAPISKVFLFAEVESKLLDLCWQQGGLTKGSSVVLDALKLVQEMLKHADKSLQDLVWQRPQVASRFTQLMDLRGADEFLHPEDYIQKTKHRTASNKGSSKKSDDDDDLDSLLQSGDSKKKKSSSEKDEKEADDVYIPRLSQGEEAIVDNVIEILHILLETESLRHGVWKQHPGMCGLAWEMALVNPANPPACGMPSAELQQRALELVAVKLNDIDTMDRHGGLDRLLFLVCTGGGNAQTYQQKMGTSQAALAVLRETLNGERIHELLIHTLAPPPQEEEGPPPGPTVVQKLWNTVVENLSFSPENDDQKGTRGIFLSGALGGLSLMLYDEQSREMMSKVVPTAANADVMLEALQTEKDTVVQWTVLRFLCEWIMDTPLMVQKLLSSTASTNLAPMAAAIDKDFAPLIHLLLGLAMEFLRGDEEECGGWTRAGILQVIQKVGISKFTSSLEGLKKVENADLPCFASNLEYKYWTKWYNHAVWVVRKRVVEELAGGGNGSDESDVEGDGSQELNPESKTAATSGSGSSKSLQKMIAQQSKEIDDLRQELEQANIKNKSQEHQLVTWKRRMESNPTELDSMLSEMTNKTASLEAVILELNAHADHVKVQHKDEVDSLNSQLSEVRQQADESRASEQEAREDRERMEQELSALSQAYAGLEEEYQREKIANANPSFSAGAPTGEALSRVQKEQEGDESHQQSSSGSTEIATLKAENTRLRNDSRAADDWMKMAVNRMNEMGAHSNRLEQQVSALNNQIESSKQQVIVGEAQQAEEQQLRDQIANLESQLQEERTLRESTVANASSASQMREGKEQEWRQQLSSLESQLQETRALLERTTASASGIESQLRSQLEQEGHNSRKMHQQVLDAQEEARTAVQEKKAVEEKLVHETAVTTAPTLPMHAETPPSVSDAGQESRFTTVDRDGEIDAVRTEMERSRQRFEEDIYKKESRIRELEDRLSSGLGSFKVEDIRVRDEEIEELRAANEEAQDWMSKAMEHHQLLSTQVAALSEEKATLLAKLESVEVGMNSTTGHDEIVKQLVNEIKEKSQIIEAIQENLTKREEDLARLRAATKERSGMEQDLGIARDDMSILQKQYAEAQETINSLEQKFSGNVLNRENENLKTSNADLQERLDQFQAWADVAQKKIGEILAAKKHADKVIAELESSKETLEAKNKMMSEELDEMRLSHLNSPSAGDNDAVETRDGRMVEELGLAPASVAANDDQIQRLEDQISDLEAMVASLNSQLQTQEEVANSAIAQWQESSTDAENRCAELDSELATLRDSLNSQLQEQEEEANAAISQWQDSYAEVENRCSQLEKDINALREEKQKLEKTPEASAREQETFQQEKSSLDAKLSSLENAIDEELDEIKGDNQKISEKDDQDVVFQLRQELEAAQSLLSQDEDVVHQWEDRVSELESTIKSLEAQLDGQEQEANNVITQWQESFSEADDKRAELDKELTAAKEEIELLKNGERNQPVEEAGLSEYSDSVIREWREKVVALEEEVASLKSNLVDQQNKANNMIGKLQESVSTTGGKCQELEMELEAASERLMRLHGKEEQDNTERRTLKDSISKLKEQNENLENKLSSLTAEHNIDELLRQLQAKEYELVVARETLARDEDVVKQWEERVAEVESVVESLETQLQEQESEANTAITEWQNSSAEMETRVSGLEEELKKKEEALVKQYDTIEKLQGLDDNLASEQEAWRTQAEKFQIELANEKGRHQEARDEIEALTRSLDELKSDSDAAVGRYTERAAELESSVERLQHQLLEQETEANSAITEWQGRVSEVESRFMSQLDSELSANKDALADRNSTISKLQAEVATHEKVTLELKELLEHSAAKTELLASKEATKVLKQKLASEQEARRAESETFGLQLTDEKARHQEARDEIEALTKSLDENRSESEDVVNQWTERVDELESLVDQLQNQMQQEEEDANDAISSWESKTLELEKDLDETATELDKLREDLKSMNNAVSATEARLTEAHQNRTKALEGEKESLEKKLLDVENELDDTAKERNRIRDALASKSREKLEDERGRLIAVVTQLEEELREANEMSQAHATDEAAEKATEIAADALRVEINELKCDIDEYRQQIRTEQMSRQDAELEIERLCDDIATLAALTNQGDSTDDLELRTAKAKDTLKMKERVEIEDLRKSLYRALDELDLAREAEREAIENLSKVRLQTSVCEQEIVAAKSEIHFLTQALEEQRLAEESKKASLEYRIGSLEDENDVLRKYHGSELEDIRHDLSQMTMEKDRAVHQRRELETTNAALVFAASKEESDALKNADEDNEAEIARLRVENAHLLTVAADEKARSERRLRENLAAQVASTEADAILEHELRVNAEETMKRLKLEVEELKKGNLRNARQGKAHHISEAPTEKIDAMKKDLTKLKKENSSLKHRMEKEASKAKASIDALTEECRKAQAKAHKAERDGRYDSAVKSEVTRLRMSPSVSTPETRDDVFLRKPGSASHNTGSIMNSSAAYDLIQRQKEEIQEERKMYLEFLAEHDDLLALLAQQDVERICLRDALSSALGEEAVEKAVRAAEEKTMSQYGKIIKVSEAP